MAVHYYCVCASAVAGFAAQVGCWADETSVVSTTALSRSSHGVSRCHLLCDSTLFASSGVGLVVALSKREATVSLATYNRSLMLVVMTSIVVATDQLAKRCGHGPRERWQTRGDHSSGPPY